MGANKTNPELNKKNPKSVITRTKNTHTKLPLINPYNESSSTEEEVQDGEQESGQEQEQEKEYFYILESVDTNSDLNKDGFVADCYSDCDCECDSCSPFKNTQFSGESYDNDERCLSTEEKRVAAKNFIGKLELEFSIRKYNDRDKIIIAYHCMVGYAAQWMQQIYAKNKDVFNWEWKKFRKLFASTFVPSISKYNYSDVFRMMNLRMKNSQSVNSYTQEFELARHSMSFEETKKQTIGRYINGLRQPIRDAIIDKRITTLRGCIRIAKLKEAQFNDEAKIDEERKSANMRYHNHASYHGRRNSNNGYRRGSRQRNFRNHN